MVVDTDVLIYRIKTQNVYEGLHKHKELFDFNNYSKDSKYYNCTNNLIVGKMTWDEKWDMKWIEFTDTFII